MNDNNELLVKEEPTRPSRLRIFGTTCIGIVLALIFLFVVFVPTVDKFGQFPPPPPPPPPRRPPPPPSLPPLPPFDAGPDRPPRGNEAFQDTEGIFNENLHDLDR